MPLVCPLNLCHLNHRRCHHHRLLHRRQNITKYVSQNVQLLLPRKNDKLDHKSTHKKTQASRRPVCDVRVSAFMTHGWRPCLQSPSWHVIADVRLSPCRLYSVSVAHCDVTGLARDSLIMQKATCWSRYGSSWCVSPAISCRYNHVVSPACAAQLVVTDASHSLRSIRETVIVLVVVEKSYKFGPARFFRPKVAGRRRRHHHHHQLTFFEWPK